MSNNVSVPAHQPASVHYHTDTKYFPPLHHAHTAHAKAHKMSGQGKGDVRAAEARINALMKRSDAVEGTQEKILSILHDTCEEEVEVRIAQLSDAGAMAVAEAIKHTTRLRLLDLRGNIIGAEGGKAIGEALHHNTSITKLNLSWNDIGAEGAQAIAETLHHNTSITALTLSSNNIGAEGARALGAAVSKDRAFTLDIS